MSHQNNTRILEDSRADFELFLHRKDFKNAEALLDNLWELGFKREAIELTKAMVVIKMSVGVDCCKKIGNHHQSFCPNWDSGECQYDGVQDIAETEANMEANVW